MVFVKLRIYSNITIGQFDRFWYFHKITTFNRLRGSLGSLNTLNANGGYLYGMLVSLILPVQYLPLVIYINFNIKKTLCFHMQFAFPQWYINLRMSSPYYKIITKVTLLPSALFLLVACLLPESPLWLIRFIIILISLGKRKKRVGFLQSPIFPH